MQSTHEYLSVRITVRVQLFGASPQTPTGNSAPAHFVPGNDSWSLVGLMLLAPCFRHRWLDILGISVMELRRCVVLRSLLSRPLWGAEYCDEHVCLPVSVSVCLFVCLSARISLNFTRAVSSWHPRSIVVTSSSTRPTPRGCYEDVARVGRLPRSAYHALTWLVGRRSSAVYSAARLSVCRVVLHKLY